MIKTSVLVSSVAVALGLALSGCASGARKGGDSGDTAPAFTTKQVAGYTFDWDDNIAFMPTPASLDEPVKPGARPRWQGPSFHAFVTALSNPNTAAWTTVVTTHGHSPQMMLDGLTLLQRRGYLKHLPPPENFYTVSVPSHEAKSPAATKAKVEIVRRSLDRVEGLAITEDMAELMTPDGKARRRLHLWQLSEDDYKTFKALQDALSKDVRGGRWPHVKVVLFYTGVSNPGQPPRAVVLSPKGGSRTVRAEEAEEATRVSCGSTTLLTK